VRTSGQALMNNDLAQVADTLVMVPCSSTVCKTGMVMTGYVRGVVV